MTLNKIKKSLQNLKAEVKQKYRAEMKGIFGSYARGESKQDSDIDLLVEFQKGATLLDLTGLGNFLEEKLQCKVDIVSERAVRKELKPYIYNEMVYL